MLAFEHIRRLLRTESGDKPLLRVAVGAMACHAGQTQLYLTPLHVQVDTIKSRVANVRAALGHVARYAEQFPKLDRWRELLRYICARITAPTLPQRTPIAAIATG